MPVIGEFGVLDKSNESTRIAWVEYYVKYARKKILSASGGMTAVILNYLTGATIYFISRK